MKTKTTKKEPKVSPSQKAAGRRMLRAENLMYQAAELLQQAQSQISVIVGGLNQNYAKIGALREKVKGEMYDLERCRETGLCDLDSPWLLEKSR